METAGAGPGWGAAGSGPARGAQEGRRLAGGQGERSFVPQVIAHCNPRAQTHTLNFRSLLGPSREPGAKPCRPRPELLLTAPSGRLSAPVCSRSFVSSRICSLDRRRVSRTLGDGRLAPVPFCHTPSRPHFTKEETGRRLRGVTVPD